MKQRNNEIGYYVFTLYVYGTHTNYKNLQQIQFIFTNRGKYVRTAQGLYSKYDK